MSHTNLEAEIQALLSDGATNQEYMQTHAQTLEDDVRRVMEEKQDDAAFRQSADKVKETIKSQLDATSRFISPVNEAYASLVGNYYAVLGAKFGVSPEEMYSRYSLKVGVARASGAQFEQALPGALPKGWVAGDGNTAAALWRGESQAQAVLLGQTVGKLAEDIPGASGYSHSVSRSALNHIRKSHGDAETEARRGQLAITDADIYTLASIPSEYDGMRSDLLSRRGLPLIAYVKRVDDGVLLYVEEVHKKRRDMAAHSLWKYPAGADAQQILQSAVSEPNVQNDGGHALNLVQDDQEFNQSPNTAQAPSQSFADTEHAYGGRAAYDKAKADGKTKLNYQQWVQVRTPEFKAWFGDWEAANILNGEPLAKLKTDDAPAGGFKDVAKWAAGIFAAQGGKAVRAGLGEVVLDRRAAQDSLAHGGANKYKKVAFAAVKDVIERGALVWQGSDGREDSFYFSAPVEIDGTTNIETVLVHRDFNTQRMYLHSIITKENLLNQRVSSVDAEASERSGSIDSRGVASILQGLISRNGVSLEKSKGRAWLENLAATNPQQPQVLPTLEPILYATDDISNVSKVVDQDTGEPLVVYHGTRKDFSAFNPGAKQVSGDVGHLGFFFTDDPHYASSYSENLRGDVLPGGRVIPAYLSIRHPRIDPIERMEDIEASHDTQPATRYRKVVQKEGHDGIVFASDTLSEFVAFSPNQIKSAAGNTGAFSPDDPNILNQGARGSFNPSTNTIITKPENINEAVAHLATLPSLEYEQRRDNEAKRLGVRASALDKAVHSARKGSEQAAATMFTEVAPWPSPVDPHELLDDVRSTILLFIVCEPETAIAATLWIAFTHFIDVVDVAPLATITAPEKRCGKSQLLDLIGRLSRRSLVASNISSAAVYRVIEAHNPTLLIDEADSFMKENEELRGVINSGHTRRSAFVIRNVGDDHEPRQFSTWGAKAISGIGHLSETVMDRSIVLELRRKLPTESVMRLRHADPGLFEELNSRLVRLAQDAEQHIKHARPDLPSELNDRAQDNWEPLLAIADYAGGAWPELARSAALKIFGSESEPASLNEELRADIQEAFTVRKTDKMRTHVLIDALIGDELRPWANFNRGKPINPSQIAKRLAGYGVKPADLRIGHDVRKGYKLEQFADVFARYLHADPGNSRYNATKPEEAHSAAPSRVALPVAPEIAKRYTATPESVAESEDVAPPKATPYTGATPKPALEMRCSGVAPTGGVAGDAHGEVF